MINFFRKIRKKLADDNKPLKYMRYAIGEITLILIGIILALQLNSWNDNRMVKAESQELLDRLIVDLERDLLYLDAQEKEYIIWLQQIDHILYQVLDNDSIKISKLEQFIAGRMSMNFLKVDQITFTEMFNSGKKLKFNNGQIIREIKEYYQYAEIELEKLNSDNEIFYKWSLETYGDEFSIIHRLATGRNRDFIDWSWRNDPTRKEYRHFESINIYYKIAIEENLKIIHTLKDKSKQLIKRMSEEFD
ncbi:DUF6090 family protein [Muriicola sp.]|uniref:DUF6090 family protein n=1 Tax=Muriicola sp. TaxID=2020856 RepID=UPI003C770387